ncbi:hypothetical protein SPBR_02604 [Sporothrix brasiliensis 5110]|uniref:Ankyrin repeat protein n=1 Tax=Sporothrix brasiliensis 5110 TaxID=1398154 RepID=A0A0C2F091_9PEZI|nr:uncharacterized protein SPBR_02604 [Sporothrix brasiliensis 5110]KIH92209.1 hypothetical protein SPBR_02604 [Sporothrix brasiliensis 5110]
MATQDNHGPDGLNGLNVDTAVDADADPGLALREAFRTMRFEYRHPAGKEAYEFLRTQLPALMSEKYTHYHKMVDYGNLALMHEVIEADDVPAMRDLIRMEPDLIKSDWDGEMLCPPMVLAARLGRHAILDVMMKHRATLPPKMRVIIPEYRNDDHYLRWGSPLTTACAWGRLDTVRFLLQGMPDTDINEVALDGLTPLLAAVWVQIGPSEKKARVELIRFLLERGADIYAVRQKYDYISPDKTSGKGFDENGNECPIGWRTRPGGIGNALALALSSGRTAPGVVAVLVEAGVRVYEGHLDRVSIIDIPDEVSRFRRAKVYISPIAVGAKSHNVDGVKALLALFPDDHTRLLTTMDVVLLPQVPQPPTPLRDPDDDVPDNEVAVLLPLHAAAMGTVRLEEPTLDSITDECKTAVDMVRLFTADKAICAATINARYRGHYTPLHLATGFHQMPLMLALIERGADIEALPRHNGPGLILSIFSSVSRNSHCSHVRYEASPWFAAEMDASFDVMGMLKQLLARYRPTGKDAQLDAQNAATRLALVNEADARNGNTALHFTMAYRMHRSTAALLAFGARANAVNHAGQVPSAPPPGEKPSF